jgi:formylglycine-generating enzyme required for sulfatase activity
LKSARAALLLCFVLAACRGLLGYEDALPIETDGSVDASSEAAPDAIGSVEAGSDAATDAARDALGDVDAGPAIDCLDASAGSSSTGAARSCTTEAGPLANCGDQQDADCCASLPVEGGTFSYDGGSTTVSSFSLDEFDVTVGRYQSFLDDYRSDMIPACAGKNPNNKLDPGWNPAWNSEMVPLSQLVAPVGDFVTLTAGTATKPINDITWYIAEAFCIWDGGRLPTYAEWLYAAYGGPIPQPYPWGSTFPTPPAKLAIYGCFFPDPTSSLCFDAADNIAPVGSAPLGRGRWGQLDLVGNMGQWLQDWRATTSGTCSDCAVLGGTGAPQRVFVGGDWQHDVSALRLPSTQIADPEVGDTHVGFRCARNP